MDDPLWPRVREQLESYPVRAERAVPLSHDTYRLEGSTRTYYVRVVPFADGVARTWAGDAAAQGGFLRVERAMKNRYGERMIPFQDDRGLYVSSGWTGEELSVTPSGARLAGQTLARLHDALAESFASDRTPLRPALRSQHGTWLRSFGRARDVLARERLFAADHVDRDHASRWQEILGGFLESADRSLALLEQHRYDEVAKAAEDAEQMAWNGVTFEHFVRLPSGHVSLAQTQTPIADAYLYDLARLARQVVEAGHASGVADLMDAYASIRPLGFNERAIVRAYAGFPHSGLQLAKQVRRAPALLDDLEGTIKRQQTAANELFRAKG